MEGLRLMSDLILSQRVEKLESTIREQGAIMEGRGGTVFGG